MKVLVADDDPVMRELLAEIVQVCGHEVIAVADGAQAWSKLTAPDAPRLAVLDWSMPPPTGVEICAKIKQQKDSPYVYIILVTGRSQKEDIVAGLDAGADEFLIKPVDPKEFRSRLSAGVRIVSAMPARPIDAINIKGYEVKRLLNKGAMAAVYHAVQINSYKDVALKVVRLDLVGPQAKARFAREIRIATTLNHNNIAHLYDSGIYQDVYYYYAMELIEGLEIDRWVKAKQPSATQIIEVMSKACMAVDHAHDHGIIHRDLKPANIMIAADGEPKIFDFGLAKSLLELNPNDAELTMEGILVGSPLFMAPEQAAGLNDQLSERTDVYALGVVLYYLLLGHHPHHLARDSKRKIVQTIATEPIRPPKLICPRIDPAIEAVLLRALAKKPLDRYATAGAMAADLRKLPLQLR